MRRNVLVWSAAFLGGMFYVVCAQALDPKLDPGTAPAPTFKTLDQIPPTWDQVLAPAVRFKLVMGDAAVLDKETGLVWRRAPSSAGAHWRDAVRACLSSTINNRLGWRLPSIQELATLLERVSDQVYTFPSGHPFTGIPDSGPGRIFWSSTTDALQPTFAWVAGAAIRTEPMVCGAGMCVLSSPRIWCVRGGSGAEEQ
jgi:hypothetical protein